MFKRKRVEIGEPESVLRGSEAYPSLGISVLDEVAIVEGFNLHITTEVRRSRDGAGDDSIEAEGSDIQFWINISGSVIAYVVTSVTPYATVNYT